MKKTVLIAPLNWGIGHATRCIPIIKELLSQNFIPIIASDGAALHFLQKEFPNLEFITLPGYNIQYPKNGKWFLWKMMKQIPKIQRAIIKEQEVIQKTIATRKIDGIISDNRYGVYHENIPSVIISHQLKIFSGIWTPISSYYSKKALQKFDECWIPDVESIPNLSGNLSHQIKLNIPKKFIGCLSRFSVKTAAIKHDILILISGPEPQRTQFQNKMFECFKNYPGKTVMVCGKIEKKQQKIIDGNITSYNYMLTAQLENLISESKYVVSRSGYSTVMDLAVLQKKAFFIPTKGQTEQEYIANHLMEQKTLPYALEKDFKIELLESLSKYQGFPKTITKLPTNLFGLF